MLETPIQLTRPDGTDAPPVHAAPQAVRPGPVVSFFYQPDLEATLSERLAAYPNVQVCRGREVTGFAQDDDGVTVHHRASASGQGSPAVENAARARYLVGADGGRSVVRSTLGVAMVGESFPEPWLVVDLELRDKERLLRHLPYFSFVLDPARPAVVCVQPGGHQRFEFRLGPDDSKEEMERPETARRLLARFLGDAGDDAYQVKRQVVYTFNALMAERWRGPSRHPRRRRRAHGAAVHGTGRQRGDPRRRQRRLEARSGAARPGERGPPRQLRTGATRTRAGDDRRLGPAEKAGPR